MDQRHEIRGADGLQVAVDAVNEAMHWRRRVLVDLALGRATRAMYEGACDREHRLRESWERLSNAYYDDWCQDAQRSGVELTGWIMGRIRRAVGLSEEPVSG